MLPLVLASAMPLAAQTAWYLHSGSGPSARGGSTSTFDEVRGVGVLFGGQYKTGSNPQVSNQTWTWDGQWHLEAPLTSPGFAQFPSMAFDSARGVVVMYGLFGAGGTPQTWTWDGTDWTQESPTTQPPTRADAAFGYDQVSQTCVLFGGRDTAQVPLGDTWEWNGTDWAERFPATLPLTRYGGRMAFDSGRQRLAMVGGYRYTAGTPTGWNAVPDHWEWDGLDWALVATSPLLLKVGHALFFDRVRNRMVLFGGSSYYVLSSNDTVEFDGANWMAVSLPSPPAVRNYPTGFFDAWRGTGVVMGGWASSGSGALSDTWTYSELTPASVIAYGAGCPGASGTMAVSVAQRPVLGTTYQIAVANTDALSFPWMITGLSTAYFGMAGIFQAGPTCFLRATPDVIDLIYGTNTYSLSIPLNANLLGVALHNQAVQFSISGGDIDGMSFSNAVRATLGSS